MGAESASGGGGGGGGDGRANAHAMSGTSGSGGGKVRRPGGTSGAADGGVSGGGGGGRKNSRPRKKSRIFAQPEGERVVIYHNSNRAPATAQGLELDAGRPIPENMHEYRDGCLRLEKVRHEKVYQAKKRLLYAERAIDQSYERDIAAAEEAFSTGIKQVMERMLMDNLARTQRYEEERYGVAHRPSEATLASGLYGNGARPHGMELRERKGNGGAGKGTNGSGDEQSRSRHGAEGRNDDDTVLPPVDGGRTARRSRKEARNGNNNHAAQPRVRLQMALDPEAVDADLAKIARGKRTRDDRDHNTNERRSKKRK